MFKSLIMKNIFFLLLFVQFFSSCTNAQEKKTKQTLAVCTDGKGCEFSEITIAASEVDKLLGKNNFWTSATANATLVLENCESKKDEKQTLEEIDRSYGGSGQAVVLKKIDLERYLKEKRCFAGLRCHNRGVWLCRGNVNPVPGLLYGKNCLPAPNYLNSIRKKAEG